MRSPWDDRNLQSRHYHRPVAPFLAWILLQEGLHGKLAERMIYEEEPSGNALIGDLIGEGLFLFIGEGAMMQAIECKMPWPPIRVSLPGMPPGGESSEGDASLGREEGSGVASPLGNRL
jgi:hypothetical protein